jgi:hypothetical protein
MDLAVSVRKPGDSRGVSAGDTLPRKRVVPPARLSGRVAMIARYLQRLVSAINATGPRPGRVVSQPNSSHVNSTKRRPS